MSGDREVNSWGCDLCGRQDTDPSGDSEESKRRRRGCDAPNPSIAFDWAPELDRCPWSLLADTPQVYDWLTWWDDWEAFRILPYGHASLNDEPAIVYSVLKECARVRAEVAEEQRAAREAAAERERRRIEGL